MGVIRMPTRTRIMGQVFKVRQTKTLTVHLHETSIGEGTEDKETTIDLLGMTDNDMQEVFLYTEQGPDKMRETFLHEHLHAMLTLAGISDQADAEVEERIVKRLAPIMLQFLRDNPNVYTFLTGRYTHR